MRRRLRSLPLVVAASLLPATGAYGALSSPDFRPTPFTKGVVGLGNATQVKINWLPGLFAPTTPQDHHDILAFDLDAGGPATSATAGSTNTSTTLLLTNGHRYGVHITACQKTGLCADGSID